VVLGAGHPLAGRESIRFRDLAKYPAVLMDEEPALQRTIAEFQRHGVEPLVRWRSASVQAIQSIVGRGLAYSLLMQETALSPEGRPLVFRPLADDVPTNSVMASLPAGVARSALVEETLAALRARWADKEAGKAPKG
jgi:hypothetical protein